MAMTPEKRSTSILRSVLLISQRLLASAEAVDESSVQLRYGQDWKGWAVPGRSGADGQRPAGGGAALSG